MTAVFNPFHVYVPQKGECSTLVVMSAARSPVGRRSHDSTLRSPTKTDYKRARSRVSPASKFFDQKSEKLPEPISYLHYSTSDSSPVTRPPKPITGDSSNYGVDDPFYKLEESTSRITSLVSDYERQRQESNQKMIAELDSCFQLNSNEPIEILEHSKNIVDGLMSQNRALKDSQSSVLGSLQTWMKHEGQTLIGSENFASAAAGASVEDLVAVLNSSEGVTQEKISKAVALHSDIVTKAFLAIHIYQKRIADQERLINELQSKGSPTTQVRYRRAPADTDELQKQLEKSQSRVQRQEEVIRSLNGRIEQLIGEMLASHKDDKNDAVAEENIRKGRDILELETKMERLQSQVADLTNENFKLKEKLQESESDAVYYKGMVKNLKDRADLERNKRESQAKEYISKLSARENGESEDGELKEALEKALELESENDRLRRDLDEKEHQYRNKFRQEVESLRKEFEARESQAKKQQLIACAPESAQSIIKALEAQSNEEIEKLKKEYEKKIEEVQKMNGELLKKSLAEKNDKIKELQLLLERGLEKLDDKEIKEVLAKMKAEYESQAQEKEEEMAQKMERMRMEFMAAQQKLLQENKQKNVELKDLMSVVSEEEERGDLPKEEVEVVVPKIEARDVEASVNEAIEKYKDAAEQKMRERTEELEKYWSDKYERETERLKSEMQTRMLEAEETENHLREKIDELSAENGDLRMRNDQEELKEQIRILEEEKAQIDAENKKLAKEKELLLENAEKGNGDAALSELTTAFVQQSDEITALKEEIEKLKAENENLKSMPVLIESPKPGIVENDRNISITPEVNLISEGTSARSFHAQVQPETPPIQESGNSDNSLPLNVSLQSQKSTEQVTSQSSQSITNHPPQQATSETPQQVRSERSQQVTSQQPQQMASEVSQNKLVSSHKHYEITHSLEITLMPSDKPASARQENCVKQPSILSDVSVTDKLDIACQVSRDPISHPQLAIHPSIELFNSIHDVVNSQDAVVVNPSPESVTVRAEKPIPTHLLTKEGELIPIPPLKQIDENTHPLAVHAVTKNVVDDTLQKANALDMVVSEIQAIEDETDPRKKQQLREALKPTLDVEKDSIVSEMKENISQLEKLVQQTEGMEIGTQTSLVLTPVEKLTVSNPSLIEKPKLDSQTESSVISHETGKESYVEQATQMSSRSQTTQKPSSVPQTQATEEQPKPAQRPRVKMNAAPARRMQHRFYSSEVIEILPTLKGQLTAIQQSETPREAKEAIQNISKNLNSISDSISGSIEPVIELTDTINEAESFEMATSNLQTAVDNADGLATTIAAKRAIQMEAQSEVVKTFNDSALSFLKKMGGADTTNQSEFLRDVNKATASLTSTVSELNSETEDIALLKKALAEVRAEYDKQCQLIQSLRQEIMDLKTFKDMPQVGKRLTQVRDDLKNLTQGNPQRSKFIKSLDHARQSVPGILRSCSTDGVISRIGAKLDIQQAISSIPNWEDVVTNIDTAVEKLEKDTTSRRNEKLVQNLNEQNNLLMSEVQKLRTKAVLNDRDIEAAKKTADTNIQQLKLALEMAHEQIAMLERQLRSTDHEAELAAAQQLERERHQQLCDEQKKTAQLTNEVAELKDKVQNLQERFQDMFSTATDTQTSNQILQNRTNEMLMRAQLDADKARALERMQNDTASDLEEATKKLARYLDENADLQKRIAKLETKIQDLERQNLDLTVCATLSARDGKAQLPKMIRLYQDRAALYQDQLERNARVLMEMKTRRACDQKAIILINREQTRLKEQLRLAQIKYESAKGQVSVSDKALAGRDQTIRELRREIERLRSLLRMNGPLQKKFKDIQKSQNETYEEIKQTQEEIARAEQAKDRFSGTKAVTSYFDKMLQRNRDRLAKLELQRRAYKEQEQFNQMENLRAISQIVRESEIDIPETLVIQLMPKPEPVKTLPKKPRLEHTEDFEKPYLPEWQAPTYKVTSYADNLQLVSSLVGKKSPRTLQKMIRNARHSSVVVPSAELKKTPPRRRAAERLPGLSPMTVTRIKTK